MNVNDLILKLEQMDRFTEVVINLPQENNKEGFYLIPIDNIEEITTDSNEKYVLLQPVELHGTNDISRN